MNLFDRRGFRCEREGRVLLGSHMTRLTQSNEVCAGVSLVGRSELPKGADVVNGKATADRFAAPSAASALIVYNDLAGREPSPTSVDLGTAYPIGCVRTGQVCAAILTAARRRTEKHLVRCLTRYPRLARELVRAVDADERERLFPARVILPKVFTGLIARARWLGIRLKVRIVCVLVPCRATKRAIDAMTVEKNGLSRPKLSAALQALLDGEQWFTHTSSIPPFTDIGCASCVRRKGESATVSMFGLAEAAG